MIILSNVLGDAFNAGYEKLVNLVLTAVNGQPASSLEDLRLKLKMPGVQRGGVEFAQFEFKNGKQVVLPYKGLDEAHRRISKVYAVTDSTSFFARP
jgi:hypothetical protein